MIFLPSSCIPFRKSSPALFIESRTTFDGQTARHERTTIGISGQTTYSIITQRSPLRGASSDTQPRLLAPFSDTETDTLTLTNRYSSRLDTLHRSSLVIADNGEIKRALFIRQSMWLRGERDMATTSPRDDIFVTESWNSFEA